MPRTTPTTVAAATTNAPAASFAQLAAVSPNVPKKPPPTALGPVSTPQRTPSTVASVDGVVPLAKPVRRASVAQGTAPSVVAPVSTSKMTLHIAANVATHVVQVASVLEAAAAREAAPLQRLSLAPAVSMGVP